MTSEDVIHAFFIPALRVKVDVIPGRYTTIWFNAERWGRTTSSAASTAAPSTRAWSAGSSSWSPPTTSVARRAARPVRRRALPPARSSSSRRPATPATAPTARRARRSCAGLFGKNVHLAGRSDGDRRRDYIRESILNPAAKIVAGYQPIMPTYRGQLTEEEIIQLVKYVYIAEAPAEIARRTGPTSAPAVPQRHPRRRSPSSRGPATAPTGTFNVQPRSAMTSLTDFVEPVEEAPEPCEHYLNHKYGLGSWLLTKDHKRIAILYLVSISFFFALGGLMAVLIRMELTTPEGDLFQPDIYNRLFTMHGVLMIFFFLIPGIPGVLGNFLIPLMIGAKDLAFPKINLLSWYIYVDRRALHVLGAPHGGVDTGWTFYTPLSTSYTNTPVVTVALGVFITGFSSILTGLNFIVTIHRMRAPGMTWFRLPLFVWAHYATSLIQILGTPVIAITILLLAAERVFHVGIFDPKLGGDPVLFQHFFWFYSHPAVYIMILPAMGVISELIAAFSRKPIFGYQLRRVLQHRHRRARLPRVGAPHVRGGHVGLRRRGLLGPLDARRDPLGGEGLQLDGDALQGLDLVGHADALRARLHRPLHDRRPHGRDARDAGHRPARARHVLHHRPLPLHHGGRRDHGLHGRPPLLVAEDHRASSIPKFWSKVSALTIFVGFNVTFFPQFILGYLGMPRRYHSYPAEFQVLNVMSSAGATVLGLGYLMPAIYFIWSMRYGKDASAEPVGRGRPRVGDELAAARRELRDAAGRHVGRLRVPRVQRRRPLASPRPKPEVAACRD